MSAIISLRVIIQDCLKHLDKDIDLTLSSLYALSAKSYKGRGSIIWEEWCPSQDSNR